jgi:hypothetical protein
LAEYEKLLVLADVKGLAALGREIATAAKALGESLAQANAGFDQTDGSSSPTDGPQSGSAVSDSTDIALPSNPGMGSTDLQGATAIYDSTGAAFSSDSVAKFGGSPAAPADGSSTIQPNAGSSADQRSAPPVANNPVVEERDPEAIGLLNLSKAVLSAIQHKVEAETPQRREPLRSSTVDASSEDGHGFLFPGT